MLLEPRTLFYVYAAPVTLRHAYAIMPLRSEYRMPPPLITLMMPLRRRFTLILMLYAMLRFRCHIMPFFFIAYVYALIYAILLYAILHAILIDII